MLRTVTVRMKTELSQKEFEIWMLNLIKQVAVDPSKSEIVDNFRKKVANYNKNKIHDKKKG